MAPALTMMTNFVDSESPNYPKMVNGFVETLFHEWKSTFHSFSLNAQPPVHCRLPQLPGSSVLQSPWRHVTNTQEPSTLYIMAKRNYSVYANIDEYSKNVRRFSAILHCGSGSSFILLNKRLTTLRDLITPLEDSVTIRNASGTTVPIVGTIYLAVYTGKSLAIVTSIVVKQRATEVIVVLPSAVIMWSLFYIAAATSKWITALFLRFLIDYIKLNAMTVNDT